MKKYLNAKAAAHSVVAAMAILVSTTLHESLHFAVARIMAIPADFLNMTAVGIPVDDVNKYPGFHLFLMNGVAPFFSILVLGWLGYLYIIRRNPLLNLFQYFLAWIVLLNLPYIGLQLLLVATRVRFNGAGNDFAAVAGYFDFSIKTRAVLSVIGYGLFIVLLYPLRNIVGQPEQRSMPKLKVATSKLKSILGISFFIGGLGAVCSGNWMLINGNRLGMSVIVFSALIFTSFAFAFLMPWRTAFVNNILINWLLPGVIGSLFLLPIGIIDGNDYAIFWLLIIPIVLGATFFATGSFRPARS